MSELQRRRNAKTFLDWVLANVLAQYPKFPALGAGLVVKDELVYGGARGLRCTGNASAVSLDDRFHMGSISKPMTGYLMAVLCKQGKLSWQRTLGQTWPDLIQDLPQQLGPVSGRDAWVAHYASVTLWQMMTHSAGFKEGRPSQEHEEDLAAIQAVPDSQLPAKRRHYTKCALLDRPYGGWKPADGGAQPRPYCGGSISAASMAETVTGRSWEQLMTEQVLMPLTITGYTFTNASALDAVTGPWGHRLVNGGVEAKAFPFVNHGDYAHSPAGAISLSIPSWGLWARALLKTGSDAHMTQAVLNEYFGAPANGFQYARGGFQIVGEGFWHNGDNGWHYADMFLNRTLQVAALAATNISYAGVAQGVEAVREELLAVGYAWPAMEHLSEALAPGELSVSAGGADGQPAALMVDASFASFWQASTSTPELNITLGSERWLKGLALCQRKVAAITSFELELQQAAPGAPVVLKGAALAAITHREQLVVKVLFKEPMRAKKLLLRIKSATAAPELTRLMVMSYEPASLRSLDISSSGSLWITDHARRVLGTPNALNDARLFMSHDTLGLASLVRRAAGKLWAIGDDGKLWRGESDGWFQVSGSPTLLRIAVDESNDWVWCVAADGSIRKYRGAAWSVHPGNGLAKDIAVHAGKAWVVGSDDRAYASTDTGWTLIPNAPGALRRINVDRGSLKLWALVGDGRIYSRGAGAIAWVEHPGSGRATEIALHAGTPYVVGSSNNGLWRSSPSGWDAIQILQPRG